MFENMRMEDLPGSGQLLQLQESFLLQMIREEWLSTEAVKTRLRQLKLAPLAGEGLKLRVAAAELKVPPELLTSKHGHRLHTAAHFHTLCRETAGGWKHIYHFRDEVNPLLMYFLIPSKEGIEHVNRAGRFVEELSQNIRHNMEFESTVAAGLEVKGLKRLKNAFASGLCALNRTSLPVSDSWTKYGTSRVISWLSQEEEHRLSQMLENSNVSAFERELNLLIELHESESDPFESCMYKAMRLLLLLTVIAGKFECSGTALGKYLWNSHKTLAACKSPGALKEQLLDMGQLVMEEARQARESRGRTLAEAVRKYIERNYGCELSLGAAALLFGVEESSLSRQFKQHVGIPLDDYVAKIRMAKAEQLLLDDSLKLTDLSLIVGYSSPSHFVSTFKKYSGKSPKEYRERLQKNR